jgi:KaiC/GvpD/RAD55 family RecA-like ATPase
MQDPSPAGTVPPSTLMQVQKLPTGIEGFDDICHGGLPVARSTLISGTSGTGKTVFSLNFLYNGIRQFNEPGIFVTFEESPLDILRNAASFGWNLQEMVEQDKLFLLDASPDPEGHIQGKARRYRFDHGSVPAVRRRVGGAARDLSPHRPAQGDRRHHGDDHRTHR